MKTEYKQTLQSCFYLQGNKRKLIQDILPHLDGKKVLIDLFSGSGTVALNALNNLTLLERVVCNDILTPMVGMHTSLQQDGWVDKCSIVDKLTSKTKEGYLSLREVYNEYPLPEYLYNLMMRSNNNMIRFNSKGKYNMPYGERHRFDKQRMLIHKGIMEEAEWYNFSFAYLLDRLDQMLKESNHKPEDVVIYADPPYGAGTTVSNAVYNEGGGWTGLEDQILLDSLTECKNKGYKVVISNVFENRGNINKPLIEWCTRYREGFDVYHLNIDYNNSNANKGNGKTDEVLIVSKEEK